MRYPDKGKEQREEFRRGIESVEQWRQFLGGKENKKGGMLNK